MLQSSSSQTSTVQTRTHDSYVIHSHTLSRVIPSFYSFAEVTKEKKLLSLISKLVLTNQVTNLETMRNELSPIVILDVFLFFGEGL